MRNEYPRVKQIFVEAESIAQPAREGASKRSAILWVSGAGGGLDGPAGRQRIVLVGHSFGGAVVITAGALNPKVVAVAALSSQLFGTD